MRYGFEPISDASIACVKASMVQLKLLTQSKNKLACCFTTCTAFIIWLAKCQEVGPVPTGERQSAGIVATPMLDNFLPTDCDPSGVKAL
jgi:hypothetical protein